MNLEDLLKEWSEREPNPPTFNWDDDIQWIEHPVESMSECPLIESIQLKVQKSIEARGWMWALVFGTMKDYTGCIHQWGEDKLKIKEVHEEGNTGAEALLSAYLQAIKKTAEVAND